MASEALKLLARANERLEGLDDATARDEAMTRVLDTESRLLAATGEIEQALDRARERLRYEPTPDAQRLEAELLDLRAEQGEQLDENTRIRLAADHAWDAVQPNGRPHRRRRQPQRTAR